MLEQEGRPFQYSGHLESDPQETVARACERLGTALDEILQRIKVRTPENAGEGNEGQTHFRFHVPGQPWVEITRSVYSPQVISDETLIEAFSVLKYAPEGKPICHWIINELSDRRGNKTYKPFLFDYAKDKDYVRQMEGSVPEQLEMLVDPSPADIEETVRAIQASWEAFKAGRSDSVSYREAEI